MGTLITLTLNCLWSLDQACCFNILGKVVLDVPTPKLKTCAQEKDLSCVPQQYVIPTLHRSNLAPKEYANVAVIDVAALKNGSATRYRAFQEIRDACRRLGCDHGVSESVPDEALFVASKFFDLPTKEKVKLMSNDVHKPVRYGTSLKVGIDKVQFWRVFLKHYAHPLKDWIHMWPENPPDYREKMGRYCQEVKKLGLEVMMALIESLELDPKYHTKKIEDGMQVMAVNCYPPCPEPEIALGLPPHSDYSCLIILHLSSPGLEIMDLEDATWKVAPHIPGALQVHVGDHFEVLSNGTGQGSPSLACSVWGWMTNGDN
ncbi:Leucoanthocyanidin dioxygenase [Spatholobus suberectus]|nr:Leucoanthocyanidin dioxygenase [Spatholobus suberectus]